MQRAISRSDASLATLLNRNAPTTQLRVFPLPQMSTLRRKSVFSKSKSVSSLRLSYLRRPNPLFSAQLKSQLNESRSYNSRSASPPRHYIPSHNRLNSVPSTSGSHSSTRVRSPNSSPNGNGIVLPQAPLDIVNAVSMNSPDSQFRGSTGSPELRQPSSHSDAFLDILYPGWDPDLPNPDVLEH